MTFRSSALVDFLPEWVELQPISQGRLAGHCPLCDAARPYFVVYPDSETFHCHACAASGDLYTFVMRAYGVEFRDAAAIIRAAIGGTR